MGMVQARCPRCKKLRRKAEAWNTLPHKQWQYIDKQQICYVCAKKIVKPLQ
jgi:hypothetical protein